MSRPALLHRWGRFLLVVIVLAVGAAFSGATASSDDPTYYIVQPGDSLGFIAERYNTNSADLVRLNGLSDPHRITAGQRLVVPAASSVAAPARIAPVAHRIAKGETLLDVAYAYGVTLQELTQANGVSDPNQVRVGQELVIPTAPMTIAEVPRYLGTTRLWVPYRSQFDNSAEEQANCGPATLGMYMSYFGEWWFTKGIRRDINRYDGDWSIEAGASWEALVYAAAQRGFNVFGLHNGWGEEIGYRTWTFDELMEQIRNNRPVMLLVRFWNLPGHEEHDWWGDHYILFLGITENGDVIYHDSAFRGDVKGANTVMSRKQLARAWGNTAAGVQYTAMVIDLPPSP